MSATDDGEPLVSWRRGFHKHYRSNDFLESADTFENFVSDWRFGLLPRERWTHAAHVAVAAYHAFHATPKGAYGELRDGILRFNRCCGIENTETSGFHETLTRFWWETICAFVNGRTFDSAWEAARSTVAEYGSDRDLFRMAYDHDIVRDRVARRTWVPPMRWIASRS